MTARKSRVLIVGTGGVGTLAAYFLEKGGLAEVTAVMRSNYTAATTNGIDIDSCQVGKVTGFRPTAIVKAVPDVSQPGVKPFDYILVTTKNIPNLPPTVSDLIAPAVTAGRTAIVLSQNGLNIEKPLIERFPANPLISSISYIGAEEISHAKILHRNNDIQSIGAFTNPNVLQADAEAAAKHYVRMYNPKGDLEVVYDADVAGKRWRKLTYNSSFNPLSAILRMDTPRMRMTRHVIDDLVIPIIDEIRAAAKACGVEIQEDIADVIVPCDPPDSQFLPSMGQDIAKGNLMEIENIVGEPLREGEAKGVPMPTLRVVYAIMKGLQVGVRERRGEWVAKFEEGNPYRGA